MGSYLSEMHETGIHKHRIIWRLLSEHEVDIPGHKAHVYHIGFIGANEFDCQFTHPRDNKLIIAYIISDDPNQQLRVMNIEQTSRSVRYTSEAIDALLNTPQISHNIISGKVSDTFTAILDNGKIDIFKGAH